MRSIVRLRAGGMAIAATCACASIVSMSGCAMMMEMRPAADRYTYDIGVASESDVRSRTSEILARFGYHLVRDDGYPSLHMESQWQSRAPADDLEKIRGYEIISRVSVIGAPRDVSGALMYHVLLTVENRFVPMRATSHDKRLVTSSAGYAKSIVKQMTLAFGNATQTVNDDQPPSR
jgi:hypothetical protein